MTLTIQSVVHVTPSYPPALGGLEKVVSVLAHMQSEQGLNVSVLTSSQNSALTRVDTGVLVTRLKNFVFANTIIMPTLLLKLLQVRRQDIVHLHVTQAYTPEMVWLASRIKGFKYIAHIHLDVPPTGRLGVLLKFYKSLILIKVLKGAKKVIVPTADYKKLVVRKYNISENMIKVIANATDHKILDVAKKYPHEELKLLFVGRLSSQKNIPLLLQALSYYLATYGGNFHLKIVGDGELLGTLRNEVTVLGLDKHISFLGPLSGRSLEDIYQNSNIFLLSSSLESFGIVLVEAMTKGLPIVCTDILAVRNVIQNRVNGLLVKQVPSDFAEAIHCLASDKSLYEQISVNNLGNAQEYRWGKVNEEIMKIYGALA